MSIISYNECVWKTARKKHHTAVSNDLYIMHSVRTYWLATGHQRHLLTNCCSLETVWRLMCPMRVQVSNHMHCIVQYIKCTFQMWF